MATTTIQALPYPASTDAANVPSWNQQLAQAVETKLNMVFSTTAARDAALPSPTPGMEVWISGTGEKQVRTLSGTWQTIGGRASPFAVAAGIVNYTMTSVSNITMTGIALPSGRFSQIPIITGFLSSAGGGSSKLNVRVFSQTTTSFSVNLSTGDGTVVTNSGENFSWIAVQMLSSTASG